MFITEIVDALAKGKVAYAIVGGYAVALHGAVRGTVDVDLIVACTATNYKRCEQALLSIGLTSRLPISAEEVFHFRRKYVTERNLKAWSFFDLHDPTRLVDVIITYGKKQIPKTTFTIEGKSIAVLAKRELIKMKYSAGRPQDLEDAKALERIP